MIQFVESNDTQLGLRFTTVVNDEAQLPPRPQTDEEVEEALAWLRIYRRFFMARAYTITKSAESAEDAVSEAEVKFYEHFHDIKDWSPSGVKGWFRSVVTREALAIQRKRIPASLSLSSSESRQVESSDPSPASVALTKDLVEQIKLQVKTLPNRMRQIVESHYFEDKSVQEISKRLVGRNGKNPSPESVRASLSSALDTLRERLRVNFHGK